jgi:hypothetical protein
VKACQTRALPGDTPMRAVVTGSTLRFVLSVIVYEASNPPHCGGRKEQSHGSSRADSKSGFLRVTIVSSLSEAAHLGSNRNYVAMRIMWQNDQKRSVSELFWSSWAT